MEWIIPSNEKYYNIKQAFDDHTEIDWKKGNTNFNIGDTVFIYCSKPLQKIMYKTIITKIVTKNTDKIKDQKYWMNTDDYNHSINKDKIRLTLVCYLDNDKLSYKNLERLNLKGRIQSARQIKNTDLSNYINSIFNSYNQNFHKEEDFYNKSSFTEGKAIEYKIKSYERNATARRECIYKKGINCSICGFNFYKTYGEIGKNYIHIHHIVPLHKIKESYELNPENDLIPVCPNCHAMLHIKRNGICKSVEELRILIKNNGN